MLSGLFAGDNADWGQGERRQAEDGQWYTEVEFKEFFGDNEIGFQAWQNARREGDESAQGSWQTGQAGGGNDAVTAAALQCILGALADAADKGGLGADIAALLGGGGGNEPPTKRRRTEVESGRHSPNTEQELDYWVELKRSRDFDEADRVREKLRARGVEPGDERPPGRSRGGGGPNGDICRDFLNGQCNRGNCKFVHTTEDPLNSRGVSRPSGTTYNRVDSGRHSPDTEADLDYWVDLKRSRDFDAADRLREELRARGIEPAELRPPGYVKGSKKSSGPASGPYSPDTEAQLDEWVDLKRGRDFDAADRLREELRARGIEPGDARPVGHRR